MLLNTENIVNISQNIIDRSSHAHACIDLVGIHPNRVYQDRDIPDFLDTSSVDQDHVD